MEFLAIIILFGIIICLITAIYRKSLLKGVTYDCYFSTDEVFEGEEIEFTEIVSNRKFLPVPWLKSELSTSKFLEFSELQSSVTDKTRFVTSFFTMKSFSRIRRTWKVRCVHRGVFSIDRIIVSASDILGLSKGNIFFEMEKFNRIQVKVLPLCDEYESSVLYQSIETGDLFTRPKLISDPFFTNGVREYCITDSMKSINWFASAIEQKLMVNKNDFTADCSVTVILNIQSSPYDITEVIYSEKTEKCIRLCAAVIRDCCSAGKSVRLLANSEYEGGTLDVSSADMYSLYRELAAITYNIPVDFERFLQNLSCEINDSEIIVISAFTTEYFDIFKLENENTVFLTPDLNGGEAV